MDDTRQDEPTTPSGYGSLALPHYPKSSKPAPVPIQIAAAILFCALGPFPLPVALVILVLFTPLGRLRLQLTDTPLTWFGLGRSDGAPGTTSSAGDAWIDVTYRDRGGVRQLRLLFRANQWNRRGLRVSVEPETTSHRIARERGLQDLETGDPGFDAAYLIRSSDPRLAVRSLGPVTRAWIQTMGAALGGGALTLRLEPLLGEVVKDLSDPEPTDEELQQMRAGAHHWRETLLAAIEGRDLVGALPPTDWQPTAPVPVTGGVTLEEVTAAGDSVCQVCGEAVTETTVVCRHCEVPHHADCWEFHGGCTTYGCRGTPLAGGRT